MHVFSLIFSYVSSICNLGSKFILISSLISVLYFFDFQKFLSTSLFDFSANSNPNRVIFDSVDLSLSYLFKSIIFPNFSPQFIVRFDQIPKDLSKISYFFVDLTLIYHYTPQFVIKSLNWEIWF